MKLDLPGIACDNAVVSTGTGWVSILKSALAELGSLAIREDQCIMILETKEKFGLIRLRWAVEPKASSDLQTAIRTRLGELEALSGEVCEICGNTGRRVTDEFNVRTRCQLHADNKTLGGLVPDDVD